jgi:hypothetical protein
MTNRPHDRVICFGALKESGGNQSKEAGQSGTTTSIIQYTVEKFAIDVKRFKAGS